jgi:hypothetical protein
MKRLPKTVANRNTDSAHFQSQSEVTIEADSEDNGRIGAVLMRERQSPSSPILVQSSCPLKPEGKFMKYQFICFEHLKAAVCKGVNHFEVGVTVVEEKGAEKSSGEKNDWILDSGTPTSASGSLVQPPFDCKTAHISGSPNSDQIIPNQALTSLVLSCDSHVDI